MIESANLLILYALSRTKQHQKTYETPKIATYFKKQTWEPYSSINKKTFANQPTNPTQTKPNPNQTQPNQTQPKPNQPTNQTSKPQTKPKQKPKQTFQTNQPTNRLPRRPDGPNDVLGFPLSQLSDLGVLGAATAGVFFFFFFFWGGGRICLVLFGFVLFGFVLVLSCLVLFWFWVVGCFFGVCCSKVFGCCFSKRGRSVRL